MEPGSVLRDHFLNDETDSTGFFFSFSRPDIFTKLCALFTELVDCISVEFSRGGMSIFAIDAAKIAILEAKLSVNAFLAIQFASNGRVVMGLNTKLLSSVLQRIEKDDSLLMELPANSDRLHIRITKCAPCPRVLHFAIMRSRRLPRFG